jgi:hypothetical protein
VYGQGGSFSSNGFGTSNTSLSTPEGIALDAWNGLFVADLSNNRIVYFPPNSQIASAVYGQAGSFLTNVYNNGGLSSASIGAARSVAVDGMGGFFTADTLNARVLYFNAGVQNAVRVYGQANFTTGVSNAQGISASSIGGAYGSNIR